MSGHVMPRPLLSADCQDLATGILVVELQVFAIAEHVLSTSLVEFGVFVTTAS